MTNEDMKLLGEIHQMCKNGESQRSTIFKKLDEIGSDGCSTGKRLDKRIGRIEMAAARLVVIALGIVVAGHSTPKVAELIIGLLK